jgi:hypothetical protein
MVGVNKDFSLPTNLGKVVENFEGIDSDTIICIEDLHCDPQVQQTINNILVEIKKTYKDDWNMLGIEGSWGKIEPYFFQSIPDLNIKQKVIDSFVATGDISGPEYYSIITNQKMPLYGIENKKLYLENFNNYGLSKKDTKKIETFISRIKDGINRGKKYLYTQTMLEYDSKYSNYVSGKISIEEYISYLVKQADEYGIEYSSKYPEISLFLQTLKSKPKVDDSIISSEANMLLKNIDKKLPIEERKIFLELLQTRSPNYYAYLNKTVKKYRIDIADFFPNLSNYFFYMSTQSNNVYCSAK